MVTLAAILSVATLLRGYTLDARGTGEFILPADAPAVRAMLLDVRTLEHHMPGVAGITPRSDGGYDYQTVREIPFSGEMRTTFIVRSTVDTAGVIRYTTPDSGASNWMQFRFTLVPAGEGQTAVRMSLRVRLVRASGTEIHLLAPLLGEEFLSEKMQNDITGMIEDFGVRLQERCSGGPHAQ
jgi:carbon monoxide dehydrogenase subunit G